MIPLETAIRRNLNAWPTWASKQYFERSVREYIHNMKSADHLELADNGRFTWVLKADRSHTISGYEWIDGIQREIAEAAGKPIIRLEY